MITKGFYSFIYYKKESVDILENLVQKGESAWKIN